MKPKSQTQPRFAGSGKRKDKAAIITGGDSGIGRAVAFANEGADVCIAYLAEDNDALETKGLVEGKGRRRLLVQGDVGNEKFCIQAVESAVREFGRLDILVNNAAEQHEREGLEDISAEQLEKTFRTKESKEEAFEEHHIAKLTLNEFMKMSPEDEKWHAKLKVLKELIDHHVQEGEGNLFKVAKKVISSEQAKEIGQKYQQ